MPNVIADVGAADANSYVTVGEADAYFGDSFGKSAWITLTDDVKASLLITASRTLDQYIAWNGEKVSSGQGMEWPRIYAYDRFGRMIPVDAIPTSVKYATFELAYYMNDVGGVSFAEQSIDSVKVGSIQVEFTAKSVDAGIPKFIENLLGDFGSPVLLSNNQIKMARLERV